MIRFTYDPVATNLAREDIRFKVVGFSGSADGIVAEIDTMIELIKSSDKSTR